MASYTLIIGDKNYSSWSLRPWIAMTEAGIPFAEERIQLRRPDSKNNILRHSPSGKVPALKTNGLVVCDSLAILEYLAEQHPDVGLWPEDATARALARSVSAEMHAGFAALRNEMPMDLLSTYPSPPIGESLIADITRIVRIWQFLRVEYARNAGNCLFGRFCNADAMFAPVATRFRTYQVDLSAFGDDGTAQAYADSIMARPSMSKWTEGARQEMAERAGSERGAGSEQIATPARARP
jgi:glutathione S-transferase